MRVETVSQVGRGAGAAAGRVVGAPRAVAGVRGVRVRRGGGGGRGAGAARGARVGAAAASAALARHRRLRLLQARAARGETSQLPSFINRFCKKGAASVCHCIFGI